MQEFLEIFNLPRREKQVITLDGKVFVIVGVVRNFLQDGILKAVRPMVIQRTAAFQYCLIDLNETWPLSNTLDQLQGQWKSLFNDAPMNYTFQSQARDREVELLKTLIRISLFLAIIALIILTSGLLSLTSLHITHRRGEIAVRKVLGAPSTTIFSLLIKKFVVLSGISIIVGLIIGSKFSQVTLSKAFHYHPEVYYHDYHLPILVALVIICIIPCLNVLATLAKIDNKSLLAD